MRLNLGAGDCPIEGYDNSWDIQQGKQIYPLGVPDASADEIRASHVLEHFPHGMTKAVLKDWIRAVKPGGLVKIAVPNFEYIARAYVRDVELNFQGYVSGGQTDSHDIHLAQFDYAMLSETMRECGLIGIHFWRGDEQDCSALPVSLNLAGWKRPAVLPKISAVMSTPRLGFMDNFFCMSEALDPLGIRYRTFTGAYWGQCLTRGIEAAIGDGVEWVLTLDYDTLFTHDTIEDLVAFATLTGEHVDALAPLQMHRSRGTVMMQPADRSQYKDATMPREAFFDPLMPIDSAHFGCTLLRVDALRNMKKPWFWATPDKAQAWGEERIDDDIFFWQQFAASGMKAYQANRVVIGHCELMGIWPDLSLEPVYQNTHKFRKEGPPAKVWR